MNRKTKMMNNHNGFLPSIKPMTKAIRKPERELKPLLLQSRINIKSIPISKIKKAQKQTQDFLLSPGAL